MSGPQAVHLDVPREGLRVLDTSSSGLDYSPPKHSGSPLTRFMKKWRQSSPQENSRGSPKRFRFKSSLSAEEASAQKRTETCLLVSNYEVSFAKVFDDPPLRQLFYAYLKSTLNEAPLALLIEIENFSREPTDEQRFYMAHYIASTYVHVGSIKEVNIGNELRTETLTKFEQCTDSDCPANLFDNLGSLVNYELKLENFANFLSTDAFLDHVYDNICMDSKYLQTISAEPTTDVSTDELTVQNAEQTSQLGELYNMNDHTVNDEAFELIKNEVHDESMWRPITTTPTRSTMISKNPFYIGKRGLRKFCETGVVPYTVDEVFNTVNDFDNYARKIEKDITGVDQIDMVECGKYAVTILRCKFKMVFPMKNRDFVYGISTKRDYGNNNIVQVRKSVIHEKMPVDKDYIRAVMIGGMVLEQVDETSCRYYQTFVIDMAGWLPLSLFNKLLTLRDDSYYKLLVECCQDRREKIGNVPPARSNGVVETLRYYEKFI